MGKDALRVVKVLWCLVILELGVHDDLECWGSPEELLETMLVHCVSTFWQYPRLPRSSQSDGRLFNHFTTWSAGPGKIFVEAVDPYPHLYPLSPVQRDSYFVTRTDRECKAEHPFSFGLSLLFLNSSFKPSSLDVSSNRELAEAS